MYNYVYSRYCGQIKNIIWNLFIFKHNIHKLSWLPSLLNPQINKYMILSNCSKTYFNLYIAHQRAT